MPCNCHKKAPNRWTPRPAPSNPTAPADARRIITPSERIAEQQAANRPPRAQQPQS